VTKINTLLVLLMAEGFGRGVVEGLSRAQDVIDRDIEDAVDNPRGV